MLKPADPTRLESNSLLRCSTRRDEATLNLLVYCGSIVGSRIPNHLSLPPVDGDMNFNKRIV